MQQPSEDGLQVVASIESVLHFSEVAMDVLVELERMNLETAADRLLAPATPDER